MQSKSLQASDYPHLQRGIKALTQGLAFTIGAGSKPYTPHPHRWWEYGSAITAYLDAFGQEPRKVIDVGCGSGFLGPALYHSSKAIITEVDPDERLLETRPAMFSNIGSVPDRLSFHVGDLTTMGTLGHYDAVFCMSVIEHIPEEKQDVAWRTLASMVAPGGILVVTTDFAESRTRPWHADTERVFKFDPERVESVANLLRQQGFDLDLDPTYHGPMVNDYTFFRWVARKA